MMSPDELAGGDLDDERILRTSLDPDYLSRYGPPHPLYDRLRRDRPVARVPWTGGAFWLLTRQAEIRDVLRQDPRIFSNRGAISINLDDESAAGNAFARPSLLNMDPPEHQAHRGIIAERFKPAAIAALDEALVIEKVGQLLDEHMSETLGEVDIVKVVEELSIATTCRVLGLPEEQWDDGFRFANAVANASDPFYRLGDTPEESMKLAGEGLWNLFAPVLKERARHPRADLATVLAQAEIDGKSLEFEDALTHIGLVFLGGVETTRNVISVGAYDLAALPDEWSRLCGSPNFGRLAEELVRWVTPLSHFARTLTEDRAVGGVDMMRGDVLVLCFTSANRDEAVFDRPHDLIVDRSSNPHLGFGMGEHRCLGNNLARVQIRAMFKELTTRFKRLERTTAPERPRNGNLNGLSKCVLAYERI